MKKSQYYQHNPKLSQLKVLSGYDLHCKVYKKAGYFETIRMYYVPRIMIPPVVKHIEQIFYPYELTVGNIFGDYAKWEWSYTAEEEYNMNQFEYDNTDFLGTKNMDRIWVRDKMLKNRRKKFWKLYSQSEIGTLDMKKFGFEYKDFLKLKKAREINETARSSTRIVWGK